VEFKGPVEKIVAEICGGIQSGLAHTGAHTILDFQVKVKPWLQSTAGIVEGNPHSIHSISY